MSGGFGEEASRPTTQSSSFSNNNGDGGNFECSICLDLAQDPVVTLCGHLFCWPCIYKWLHMPSRSQECPMCKASIEEQKLVPLYGRGKNPDARSESESVPNRPAGQRPETSRQRNRNAYHHVQHQHGSGIIGGFGPAFTATYGNFTFSFGGFIPSIFSLHMHAFNGPHMYGNGAHELRHHRDHHHEVSPLIVIGLLFLFALLWEPNI
ncbi:uncharacterized protein LOC111914068 [Lactuca sativa]|uniref:uncharacterized protein LOC111914068 n=1 Tax=Lactuca sativa TaxID=4236 RepID=UPI000CB7956B|nr:uncharacterized protein LOC111914068 [Lactuca sativa]XP_052620474.1 uncharacterized protein LOC111914068 [Lactuca sativa]